MLSGRCRAAVGLEPTPNGVVDLSAAMDPVSHLVKPTDPFPEECF